MSETHRPALLMREGRAMRLYLCYICLPDLSTGFVCYTLRLPDSG